MLSWAQGVLLSRKLHPGCRHAVRAAEVFSVSSPISTPEADEHVLTRSQRAPVCA